MTDILNDCVTANDLSDGPLDTMMLHGQNNLIRKTSRQNPYKVVDILHMAKSGRSRGIKGKLCISMAPGKKDKRWDRNLGMDLKSLKDNDIQIIVCLLEWDEMYRLGIADYPKRAQAEGFLFYHLPIRDGGIPQQNELNVLVPRIIQHLLAEQNIVIHCKGGLGRAGTICACCLGHFGIDGITAMKLVRERRPGAIQTRKQEECIIYYCRELLG